MNLRFELETIESIHLRQACGSIGLFPITDQPIGYTQTLTQIDTTAVFRIFRKTGVKKIENFSTPETLGCEK